MTRIRWFCSVHAYCFSEVGSEIAVCPMDFQGKPCVTGGFSTARCLFFQRIRMKKTRPAEARACAVRRLVRPGTCLENMIPSYPKSLGIGTTWKHQRVLWKLKAWCGWMPLNIFEHLWTSLNIFERLISFNANAISSISTRCRRASTSLHKQLGVEARIEIHRKLSVCLGKACLQNTSSSVEGYNVLEYIYNML